MDLKAAQGAHSTARWLSLQFGKEIWEKPDPPLADIGSTC